MSLIKNNEVNMKEVELVMPHRHMGIDYKKGDVIVVSEIDANWLYQRNIAKSFTKQTNKQEVKHG